MHERAAVSHGWIGRLGTLWPRLGLGHPGYSLRVPAGADGGLRRMPVSLLTVDGRRYAVAAAPIAGWSAAARAAGWGFLGRGRCDERVVLADAPPAERRAVLRALRRAVDGRFVAAALLAGDSAGAVYRIDGPDTCP